MASTFIFLGLVALALLLNVWWQRSDRRKENVARRVAEDVRSMGDVVAASLSPFVNPDICIGSGACVIACPEKSVLGLVGGRAALINPLGCIGHGACAKACPVDAIQLVYGTSTQGMTCRSWTSTFKRTSRACTSPASSAAWA